MKTRACLECFAHVCMTHTYTQTQTQTHTHTHTERERERERATEKVFVIKEIKNIVSWTYVISSLNDDEIGGTF